MCTWERFCARVRSQTGVLQAVAGSVPVGPQFRHGRVEGLQGVRSHAGCEEEAGRVAGTVVRGFPARIGELLVCVAGSAASRSQV